jgi:2-methylisocitrate lyase-like PEP mutase family enzyme
MRSSLNDAVSKRCGIERRRTMTDRRAKAQIFRTLHKTGFIMPNAWDAGSAKLLASEGFEAIGTTSGGIAFALGKQDYYVSDGRLAVSRETMLARIREIVDAVDIPVSGDLEAGYGGHPETVAETVRLAIEAGLAGGNIEDKDPLANGLYDERLAVERIAAARAAIGAGEDSFFLNARTDALQSKAPDALEVAVRRANLFLEAGADCVFAPGAADLETIRILVREIAGPLNIVVGLASAEGNARSMIEAGVRRISLGGSMARSALGFVRQCARELRDQGTFTFAAGQISQAALNELFARSSRPTEAQ